MARTAKSSLQLVTWSIFNWNSNQEDWFLLRLQPLSFVNVDFHAWQVLGIGPKPIACTKNVKDVGLDPMQDDIGSPSKWPSEFKRLQKEIIELWHACNISLVHRTYFFLLFKGEPADSIYMEVELRRLYFLQEIFSRGSQTVEDGQTLTPTSR